LLSELVAVEILAAAPKAVGPASLSGEKTMKRGPASVTVGPASLSGEKTMKRGPASRLPREDGNATRSDAGWVRREINCTAGWSCAGRSWRWHEPSVAIRRSTDERRAQTRVASKRVRGLPSDRSGVTVEILAAAPKARIPATSPGETALKRGLASHTRAVWSMLAVTCPAVRAGLSREDGNAPRSDAGWARREINCTAGWSCAGRSWRWHEPWVAIRSSTDERRAQTRGASKRVRGLPSDRSGDRGWIFTAAGAPGGDDAGRARADRDRGWIFTAAGAR